jgi:MFS transporter, ACS family, glucarate transporter
VSRWFKAGEQGRAMSVSFIGLAVGSAATAPLVFTLLGWLEWRWTFVWCGLLGVVWCVAWRRWFRDEPAEGVEKVEAEKRVPWAVMLRSGNLWCIGLMYFAYGYGLYFYITWLPTYLLEARGFSMGQTKWLAALPWAVSAVGFWFGGWLTDWLVARTGSLKLARCGVGASGYAASGLMLILVARVEDRNVAALLLALALGLQTTTISAAWAVCLDVGRRYAGVVTGFMNTIGNIGGALAPLVVGYAVTKFGSWTLPFYVMAAVFVFGVVMWLLVDPRRSVLVEAAPRLS